MFAEKLADIDDQCISDVQNGLTDSPFCINEEFRTINGGGDFDPFDNSEGKSKVNITILIQFFSAGCFKNFAHEHNAKDACCGDYPDRLPFDTMSRECCRHTVQDGASSFHVDSLGPFSRMKKTEMTCF